MAAAGGAGQNLLPLIEQPRVQETPSDIELINAYQGTSFPLVHIDISTLVNGLITSFDVFENLCTFTLAGNPSAPWEEAKKALSDLTGESTELVEYLRAIDAGGDDEAAVLIHTLPPDAAIPEWGQKQMISRSIHCRLQHTEGEQVKALRDWLVWFRRTPAGLTDVDLIATVRDDAYALNVLMAAAGGAGPNLLPLRTYPVPIVGLLFAIRCKIAFMKTAVTFTEDTIVYRQAFQYDPRNPSMGIASVSYVAPAPSWWKVGFTKDTLGPRFSIVHDSTERGQPGHPDHGNTSYHNAPVWKIHVNKNTRVYRGYVDRLATEEHELILLDARYVAGTEVLRTVGEGKSSRQWYEITISVDGKTELQLKF